MAPPPAVIEHSENTVYKRQHNLVIVDSAGDKFIECRNLTLVTARSPYVAACNTVTVTKKLYGGNFRDCAYIQIVHAENSIFCNCTVLTIDVCVHCCGNGGTCIHVRRNIGKTHWHGGNGVLVEHGVQEIEFRDAGTFRFLKR